MILVKKTLSLANQPPLSELDLAERSKDWQDALEGNVPLGRLPDAFARALQNHDSTFPINAFGILAAWKEISTKEQADKERSIELMRRADPVKFCSDEARHATEDGLVVLYNFHSDLDELTPCDKCRPADYAKWKRQQVALYGEHKPLNKLQSQYAAKTLYVNNKDPREIINRAIREVNADMVSAIGTAEYDLIRGAWATLTHAAQYVSDVD